MATIGLVLLIVSGIASLVFWVISIVKAFQMEDTLWGVLAILFPICGLIWLFQNGYEDLAMYWVFCLVGGFAGFFLMSGVGTGTSNVR